MLSPEKNGLSANTCAESTFTVAIAPAIIVMAWHGWAATTPLIPIVLAVGIGIALWGIALRLLKHPLFFEIKSALKPVLARVTR